MKQLDLFEKTYKSCEHISIEEVFEAYYICRKHKRRTLNALAFELNFEEELVKLWREINSGTYCIDRSITFIIKHPVQREIFAASFRDRIVHHLIINKITPILEEYFIDDSYNSRKGKGVLAGVRQAANYMKQCSENYTKDCYVMKMDLQSFFPSIDKGILFKNFVDFLRQIYIGAGKRILIDLIELIIFNVPQDNCIIKGSKNDWKGLPSSKSLFASGINKGLPIGNLTSQVMANFYLTTLDKFIKNELKIEYYIRYVDDLLFFHNDKYALLNAAEKIKKFAFDKLKIKIHPKKFYLQHYSKGINFIGACIKPGRVYIGKRTKSNLYIAIHKQMALLSINIRSCLDGLEHFVNSVNSYLGFMVHYNSYKLRHKMLSIIYKSFLHPVFIRLPDNNKLKLCKPFKNNMRKSYLLYFSFCC